MIYHLKSLFHLWYQHHFDCLRYYSSVARPADAGDVAESMMACVAFVHYDDVYDLNGHFINQLWFTHFHRMESGLDQWGRPSADGLFVQMQNGQDFELKLSTLQTDKHYENLEFSEMYWTDGRSPSVKTGMESYRASISRINFLIAILWLTFVVPKQLLDLLFLFPNYFYNC